MAKFRIFFFFIMDKYQTLDKVVKVRNIFGLIVLLLNIGKVSKVEI